jgi:6-phosphogluconate dehydrogenase
VSSAWPSWGKNLALNLADHGVKVAVYNRTPERSRRFIEDAAAGRAVLPDDVRDAFRRAPALPNLLLEPGIARVVADRLDAWRGVLGQAQRWGIPVPALSAALAYLDGYRSPQLPSNLLQAQRDYFGAHTYQRTDRPGSFHTEWAQAGGGARP